MSEYPILKLLSEFSGGVTSFGRGWMLLGYAGVELVAKPRPSDGRVAGGRLRADWVHRYNTHGLDGLKNLPNPGAPPRKLTTDQETTLAAWVREGPEPEQHQVIRWRLVDVRDEIARCFGVRIHERTSARSWRG